MKTKMIVLLPLMVCSLHIYAQKQHKVIAIGSYNCENFFDTVDDPNKKDEDFTPNGTYHYNEEVYRQKLHNIATVIGRMGTDVTPDGAAIAGLVEIENDHVLQDLIIQPEIKNRGYRYCWFPTPDERGISTAMLYNPKYFTVLNAHPVHIALESLGMHRPTRDILFVSGMLAGDTVHVLVNHWPSKSGGEAASAPGRRLAASTVKHIVDSLMNTDADSKIIIMGDFNDNPTSEGITKELQPKADKDDVKLSDIYNPWIKMYRRGVGTELYHGEWNLIDQIMLSGALLKNNNSKWKFYNAEIYNKQFLINKIGNDKGSPHRSFTANAVWDNGYSDHFPVLIYLVD